ncbi:rhodanese-like domain-containing protein [Bacillus benzoevorans]|uniref:Thiosulfate/3-mercaptopyruvate sulfurtransferase n=1 Tax=Bacillus benzoevorans TaxID=1456 RepID=A0A7X0HUK9_9BACI|nr:rhodanese-like domain-containing protein [Bacillus benzoevorans]MBB6447144.1 thiosulfate/3-mercaptopyruvate sulfurtransferase [Bacillus benzoevorans]
MKITRKIWAVFFIMMLSLVLAACSGKEDTSSKEAPKEEAKSVQTITSDELQSNLDKKDWVVVDTRITDAYNGWKLEGVERGGHIKGAVDFSATWLTVDAKDKEKQLEAALKDKGITSDKNVVLYDANGKDAKAVAAFLTDKGFKNLYTFDVNEWASTKDLAMESYPNYEMLVPAAWVNDLIKNENNGKPYKIFEASWGDEAPDYKKGHIPSAVHINTDEVEEGPVWNRLKDPALEKFALNNGITTDTTVVLYGSDSMPAYRVAVILKYMGVKDVRVLNGGFTAWSNAGYDIDKKDNAKTAGTEFGATVPANPGYIIDLPQAKEILADKEGSILVDIRSWDEFTGKISGYDYIEAKGRPAGSVWGHAGSDNSNLQDFRNIDSTMKNGQEILAMWEKDGITPDKNLSFYCGTGWRAAEVLFYADVMGLEHISLYDGGWNEWSMDPSNPVETGAPSK